MIQTDNELESTKRDLLHKTIWWLKANYCFAEGFSVSRQSLYENYQSFCKIYNYAPISTATFGKVIRQQFPQITTRRLGTRGNSKYHYHGLTVKDNSIYSTGENYKVLHSSTLKPSPAINVQHPKNRVDSAPKIQIVLEAFKGSTNEDQFSSEMGNFFIMYQTHSQQILDSILHGSFDEISKFLYSFWKGCPGHVKHLFDEQLLVDGVIIIDLQVYISVYKYVLHSMNQLLPDQYLNNFVSFLNEYSLVLSNSIPQPNVLLRSRKLFYASMFKQMSFSWLRGSHLYQLIFPDLSKTDNVSQILEDFQSICLENIIEDTVKIVQFPAKFHVQLHLYNYFELFENLLEVDFSFDTIIKWAKEIFQCEWITMGLTYKDCFLTWSIFFSKFLQEMFLDMSQSFAQVNLIVIWLEHIFYTESMVREFEILISTLNELIQPHNNCYSQFHQMAPNVPQELRDVLEKTYPISNSVDIVTPENKISNL